MGTKTDNRKGMIPKKLQLRTNVLDHVKPARVFEAFCGPTDAGMSQAWKGAELHVGCDKRFSWPDPRKRYVGDTDQVMRALDLSQFNVFDLDAYGQPWHLVVRLIHQRKWATGERGAVILTDGSGRLTQMGTASKAIEFLIGMHRTSLKDESERIHDACSHAFIAKSGVKLLKRWRFKSPGGQPMVYSSLVFEGL